MLLLLLTWLTTAGDVPADATAPDPIAFQQTAGTPGRDRGVFVTPTRDGGYAVAGVAIGSDPGGEDVSLLKFDVAGEQVWAQTYGGPDEDNGWAVHESADGYVVAGFTRSFGAGGFDFYLLFVDASGSLLESKTYGGEADDRCWALLPTAEGGYALVGETLSSGAGAEDVLLIKIDATGTEQWSRTYGGSESDRCFSVVQADDDGFVLAGQTYSEGAGDRDMYVVKTNAQGEPEWSRTFGGEASDVGHCVTKTAENEFVVTGYTSSFAESGDDPFVVKLDAEGNTLWSRSFPLDGVSRTLTGAQARDGGFFLVGFRRMPGRRSGLLVRTDREGNFQWSRDILPTRRGESFGYTVQATADGGCVFTGHTSERSRGDLDVLLVKIGPEARD